MKKLASTGLIAFAFMFGVVSCETKKTDSVEQARETNEERFEESEMEDRKVDQSDFMTKAASSGMFEVEAGKLAQQRAQNQEVKAFGKMMASDHGKANSDLKSLASKKSITLPDSMSRDHMDKLKDLREEKTGADFDKAYMNAMINAHDNDISLFEDASEDLEDQEVKTFASSKLPTLRQHRDQAKQLKDKLDR